MRIIVGVDGSNGASQALRWGMAEGRVRGCPVVGLLAYGFYGRPQQVQAHASGFDHGFDDDGFDDDELFKVAADLLDAVVAQTRSQLDPRGALAVQTVVVGTEPVEALLDFSTENDVLVVGSRGLGPVRRVLLGSTSAACAHYASAAVVVVRGPVPERESRPVVVGADGSPGAGAAIAWAAAHAAARGLPLQVVRAWSLPPDTSQWLAGVPAVEGLRGRAQEALDEFVDRHPWPSGLQVRAELIDGHAASVLLDSARNAALLVLGSRGSGGFERLLLGSTGTACLTHASSTVAIIHPPVPA